MQWPDEVVSIVTRATERHGENIDKAAEESEVKIRALPEFKQIQEQLVTAAVRELVYDHRHRSNVEMKRETGHYDTQRAFQVGSATAAAYQSVYDYYISGMQLGSVLGSQLADISASEFAKANGHAFNAQLCLSLKRVVPDDKRVRDCVSEPKLRAMFTKIQKQAKAA